MSKVNKTNKSSEPGAEATGDETKVRVRRMFGKYVCPQCKKFWVSAYAWEHCFQLCFECRVPAWPFSLKPLERKKEKGPAKRGHMGGLCEQCRKFGDCSLRTEAVVKKRKPRKRRPRKNRRSGKKPRPDQAESVPTTFSNPPPANDVQNQSQTQTATGSSNDAVLNDARTKIGQYLEEIGRVSASSNVPSDAVAAPQADDGPKKNKRKSKKKKKNKNTGAVQSESTVPQTEPPQTAQSQPQPSTSGDTGNQAKPKKKAKAKEVQQKAAD